MRGVDLFSGCGGLSLGLIKSGIDIVAAYENWDAAISIYKNNFDHPVFKFDLTNVKLAIDDIKTYNPDIIVGGPPCQDFSSAGKRNENGNRADLTSSFAKIIIGVSPEWFLMENVERIVKTKIFLKTKSSFIKAGYGLTQIILDASLCGVPQKRKRMFLIGKKNEKTDFLKDSLIGRLASKSMTVRQYFKNKINTEYYYRHARSYSRRGIFSIDEPSPTIRGVNRPIPPDYKFHSGDATTDLKCVRPLTTIERATIQTFPTNFKWVGNKSTLEQAIGNAVPVKLAEFVGKIINAYDHNPKLLRLKTHQLELSEL